LRCVPRARVGEERNAQRSATEMRRRLSTTTPWQMHKTHCLHLNSEKPIETMGNGSSADEKSPAAAAAGSAAVAAAGAAGKMAYDSAKGVVSEQNIRSTADRLGSFPTDPMKNIKIHYTSSMSASFLHLKSVLRRQNGTTLVLYGSEGSGLTTTLHASIRGRRAAILERRGVVLDAEIGKDGNDWIGRLREILGSHAKDLSARELAKSLVVLLATEPNMLAKMSSLIPGVPSVPEAYDPNTEKRDMVHLHGCEPGCSSPAVYKTGANSKLVLLGIDNFDFGTDTLSGDNNEAAKDFLQSLITYAAALGVVVMIATHSLPLAKEIVELANYPKVVPMITSLKQKETGTESDTKEKALETLLQESSHWEGKLSWNEDGNLRMTAEKTKRLLTLIFPTLKDGVLLEDAVKKESLSMAIADLQAHGYSPQNSPQDKGTRQGLAEHHESSPANKLLEDYLSGESAEDPKMRKSPPVSFDNTALTQQSTDVSNLGDSPGQAPGGGSTPRAETPTDTGAFCSGSLLFE